MHNKIGLSVSFCIRDIAEGKVDLNDVHCIVAGTKIKSEEGLDLVITQYRDSYWSGCADKAEEIFRLLWNTGKIYQPRLTNNDNDINIANGHWV